MLHKRAAKGRRLLPLLYLLYSAVVASTATAAQAQQVAGMATVQHSSDLWAYSVQNNEVVGSSLYLDSFFLAVDAAVTDITAPAGWGFNTDAATYIAWYNTDTALPYLHDVSPGTSLSGFQFRSGGSEGLTDYFIESWNHTSDDVGPTTSGVILAPSVATVPELSAQATIVFLLGLTAFWLRFHLGNHPTAVWEPGREI